jgi:putative CocE/NonD family hydrolase
MRKIEAVEDDKDHEQLKAALKEHEHNSALNVLDKINFRDDQVFQMAIADGHKPTPLVDHCLDVLKARFGPDALNQGIEIVSPTGYWKEINKANVPMYFGAGWDEGTNANGAIKRFMNYTVAGDKLILGPWDHNLFNISPYTRGGLTCFRLDRELLKFFDYHLKGENAGMAADKPVHYYTLGEEKWHGSDSWPPATKPATYFLTANRRISAQPSDSAGGDSYNIDAGAETGHDGRWDCLMGNVLLRPYPQRKAEDKRLLVYNSQPLTEDCKIAGHPEIKIFLTPNGEDCTLFAYLEDVTPAGAVHYVTEGQVLCGNRLAAHEEPLYKTANPMRSFLSKDYKPLTPNQVTAVDLELQPIAYQFKKGHRIRLSLAGTDKAHFIAPPFAHLSSQFKVCWGGETPSQITLPVDENKF